jgi:phosphoglycerate kinase
MFTKKTIFDIDLTGKTVLMRADYNVPIEHGRILDDFRIRRSLATIRPLLDKDVRLVICSHLGRPEGRRDPRFSLRPVAERLRASLGENKVCFAEDCVGAVAEQAVERLQPGQVLLLENLRFHPEEQANDPGFARALARLADVFVEDGFGVVHRAHASTVAVTQYLPSAAGLLLQKEVETITGAIESPRRPLVALIGGGKVADKLDVLCRLSSVADLVALGGAMATTFLAAAGVDVGTSRVSPADVKAAREICAEARERSRGGHFGFYVPHDVVVARKADGSTRPRIVEWDLHSVAGTESYPDPAPLACSQVAPDELVLDIGPLSAALISGTLQLAGTVVWNGTMGVTETAGRNGQPGPFARGTQTVVDAALGHFGHRPFSIVGGGDTVSYLEERRLVDSFDHVSTGGGAFLELAAGRTLPGIEALPER